MTSPLVEQLVNAVLYEGYILYPYRASSVKNRQRWTFGGLYPQAYSEAGGGTDPWTMQTECLVTGDEQTTFQAKVRCLHLLERSAGELLQPLGEWPARGEPDFRVVGALRIDDTFLPTWQEAEERAVPGSELTMGELLAHPQCSSFRFAGRRQLEPVRGRSGAIAGVVLRRQETIEGTVELAAQRVDDGLFKVTVRVHNRTPLAEAGKKSRDEALLHSLVSTHAILGVRGGEFVSLLDPPETWRDFAAGCRNVGAWPVLVGAEGEKHTLLASPIILYDYPQIAPESPGDLFDASEIDEILTLRILTLTAEEKKEMVAADERARALLSRTEALARDQLLGLHGTVRSLRALPRREDHA